MGAFLEGVTYSEGGRRVPMEGDILAYLNQKEFPTRTYPFFVRELPLFHSVSPSRKREDARPSVRLSPLSVLTRRWSGLQPMQHAQLRVSRV